MKPERRAAPPLARPANTQPPQISGTTRRDSRAITWLFCLLALFAFVVAMRPAAAATLTVTNNADSGPGSLRAQVTAAAAGDSIVFTNAGPVVLASPITVSTPITISGPSANLLTISGNNVTRIFNVTSTVSISGVTLQNGFANGTALRGGAISNTGSLTLDSVVLKANVAFDGGGAIYNESTGSSTGQLNIRNSQLSGNSVSDASGIGGGAILSTSITGSSASVTIVNSTITGNSANANALGSVGGGIYFASGALKLVSSTVVANNAGIAGGNIHQASVANTSLSLRNSIVSGGVLAGSGATPDDIDIFQPGGATVTSLGYSIITNRSAGTGYALTDAVNGTNPLVGVLAANGGPTQTMLPLPMSPASAFVPLASCVDDTGAALTRDQRGVPRQTAGASTCDGGATEASRLSITTTLPNGLLGSVYSQSLSASGGLAPFGWSLASGTLPAGLSLAGDVISGTATATGSYSFDIGVIDQTAASTTRAYIVAIQSPPAITTLTLPNGTVGIAYSTTISATGSPAPTFIGSGLPPGLLLGSAGVLSGTPTLGGTYPAVTVTASNGVGSEVSRTYSVVIAEVPCSVGTFSATGNTPCTPASPGNYVSTVGATAQTACAAGSFSSAAGASACTLASAGSFVPAAGASAQMACAAGSFSATTGATACGLASAGSFVSAAGATAQTACAPGSYSATPGATACALASAGSFVPAAGATAQISCAAGSYSAATGATACTLASAGSYVPTVGAAAQTACAAGTFSAGAGASACTAASAGSYVATTGATAQTACAVGTFSASTGATACTLASAGNFVSTVGAAAQTACAAGSFSATTGATACTPANAGNFVSTVGATAQTACAAGSFSATTGATACAAASAGSFVSTVGAATQTACAAGTFSAGTGAVACTPAGAGNFVASSGATSQTPCAAGTFSATAAVTACTPAAVGFFVPTVGATSQTVCAAGTTSLTVGATVCVPITYTVTPSAGLNGAISPNTSYSVATGQTTVLTVTPDVGYNAVVGGTCTGTLAGTTYTTNPVTADCTVSASFTIAASLSAAQSRKNHGGIDHDILIDRTALIGGNVTVEPRIIGAGHQIVFQFTGPVNQPGTASAAPAGSATAAVNPSANNEVIVTLTGTPDNGRVTVSLANVNGVVTPFSASLGFLIGDVNGTRSVNSSDISGMKARSGQSTTALNFRFDVNATGAIDSSDISAVKARSGMALLP